jgi:A/G-specific adenine glycosylase
MTVPDIEDLVTAHTFTSSEISHLQKNLLEWYNLNRRKLPWRGDPPPYTTTLVGQENAVPGGGARSKGAEIKSDIRSFFGSGVHRSDIVDTSIKSGPHDLSAITHATVPPSHISAEAPNVGAYRTWVSEIMLQQTRVATVIGYFERWTSKFPDIHALASASEEEVNAQWAGLGYYSRARNLRKAARQIVEASEGRFPADASGLVKVPGIGRYTAGAVSSIAFGRKEAVVDGNVIRVLSRLRAIPMSKKDPAMHKLCWRLASEIVPEGAPWTCPSCTLQNEGSNTQCNACGERRPTEGLGGRGEGSWGAGGHGDHNRPGTFNQAVMELGATICTPKSARCDACPVASLCRARTLANEALAARKLKGAKNLAGRASSTGKANVSVPRDVSSGATGLDITDVTSYPIKDAKKDKKRPKDVGVAVLVVRRSGTVLMRKRPSKGLLAGQWEPFPSTELATHDPSPSLAARRNAAIRTLTDNGFADIVEVVSDAKDAGLVVHTFSHRRHHMSVDVAELGDRVEAEIEAASSSRLPRSRSSATVRWMNAKELAEVGVTTCARKVLARAGVKLAGVKRNMSKRAPKWKTEKNAKRVRSPCEGIVSNHKKSKGKCQQHP